MRLNDPEYKRQKALIESIQSNKIDVIDLSGISEQAMAEYESQHERDLRAQVSAFDDRDKRIVVDEILKSGWTHVYNVLGDYIETLYNQIQEIKKTTGE